nr:unnamed protein product [Callosobruchus analis]
MCRINVATSFHHCWKKSIIWYPNSKVGDKIFYVLQYIVFYYLFK